MNVDPVLLVAYVDGELSAEAMREIEAPMAHSPQVSSYVADLKASMQPYQRAFAEQKLPALPEGLTARIAALERGHVAAGMPREALIYS